MFNIAPPINCGYFRTQRNMAKFTTSKNGDVNQSDIVVKIKRTQVDKKIFKLSQDEKKIMHLARNHNFKSSASFSPFNYLQRKFDVMRYISKVICFLKGNEASVVYVENPTRCSTTTYAILELDPFEQPFKKQFSNIDELLKDLKEGKRGFYGLDVHAYVFVKRNRIGGFLGDPEHEMYFPGHSCLIKKEIIKGEPVYQVLQSFVSIYKLSDFLQKHSELYTYYNFDALEKEFLNPLFEVMETQGPWKKKTINNFKKITLVKLEGYKGYKPTADFNLHAFRTTSTPPKSIKSGRISIETRVYMVAAAVAMLSFGIFYYSNNIPKQLQD